MGRNRGPQLWRWNTLVQPLWQERPEIVGDLAYGRFFREEIESSQQPEHLPFPVLTARQVAALPRSAL